ncbi:MAG: hypothetical protein P4N59_27040 [Negativicutes bacterium]|nr:hypothetical protein [Negativicutes bacterium]
MDKKTQQSKSKYGTLTATSDANNDYQAQSDTTGMTSGASSATTSSSVAEYGTMTAKFDANSDYGKSGSQNKGTNQQQQQAGGKKVQTSDKNIGH